MALSLESLTLAKKYVDESLAGVGAVKGSPCEIKEVNFDDNGNTVITFYWLDKDNKEYTVDVTVNKGLKGDKGDSVKGDKGDPGEQGKGVLTVLKDSFLSEQDILQYLVENHENEVSGFFFNSDINAYCSFSGLYMSKTVSGEDIHYGYCEIRGVHETEYLVDYRIDWEDHTDWYKVELVTKNDLLGLAEIDDNNKSTTSTYSSNKIEELVGKGGGTVPENVAVTDKNNNFTSAQTVNGTFTVNGNIVQNGESYETHAEKIYTKNDLILTRDGAVGGLGDNEYTGIQAKKYDGDNDGILAFDANGTARVGDIDDTQPILTRDEESDILNGQLLQWDSTNKKAVGVSPFTMGEVYSTDETVCGVWLDGRPIYKKCFYTTVPTTSTTGTNVGSTIEDLTEYNISSVCGFGGIMIDTNIESIPSVVPSGTTIALVRLYISGGTIFTITNNYKGFNGRNAIVYLKYTKTTDEPNSGLHYIMSAEQYVDDYILDTEV